MLTRAYLALVSLLFLGGCVSNVEPAPKIVYYPSVKENFVSHLPFHTPKLDTRQSRMDVPKDWIPSYSSERKWTAIVIHHSATENGSAAIFDKWHRENRHWEGVGYDFVIGNGSNSGDGQVEVTFRWRQQRTGAHCKTPNNWANEDAVGICLVGNFNLHRPTQRQMQSLVKLVRFLQVRYGISKSRIYGHRNTPGAGITDCPGKHFSLVRLKSML